MTFAFALHNLPEQKAGQEFEGVFCSELGLAVNVFLEVW
jgi:hypothetical protein